MIYANQAYEQTENSFDDEVFNKILKKINIQIKVAIKHHEYKTYYVLSYDESKYYKEIKKYLKSIFYKVGPLNEVIVYSGASPARYSFCISWNKNFIVKFLNKHFNAGL